MGKLPRHELEFSAHAGSSHFSSHFLQFHVINVMKTPHTIRKASDLRMIFCNNSFLLENSKMTINKMLSCLLVVSALTFFALPAFAGKGKGKDKPPASANCSELMPSDCFDELDTLCKATSAADSLGTRDQNGLIGKVLSANVKLTQNKVSGADKKLENYFDKLNDLNEARKPKISDEDFVKLLGDVLDAQMCVGGL
jgi:hypothetical protein